MQPYYPNQSDQTNPLWERLIAIISQHPSITQSNLSRRFKTIFISRLISENVLLMLLQYMGLMFSATTNSYTPIWLASGTACAFVFLRGLTVLPGIFIGSFVAYYFVNAGLSLTLSCATLLTMQPGLLLILCYRFVTPMPIFYDKKIFLKFLAILSILTGLITYLLVKLCGIYFSPSLYLEWWLANLNSILSISCAIITWDMYFPEIDKLKRINLSKFSSIFGLYIISSISLLFARSPIIIASLAFITLPITIAISINYRWCGSIFANFIFAILLSFGAYFSTPLFNNDFSTSAVLALQILLFIECILGIYLSIHLSNSHEHTYS